VGSDQFVRVLWCERFDDPEPEWKLMYGILELRDVPRVGEYIRLTDDLVVTVREVEWTPFTRHDEEGVVIGTSPLNSAHITLKRLRELGFKEAAEWGRPPESSKRSRSKSPQEPTP
jgi:hypothetical protein